MEYAEIRLRDVESDLRLLDKYHGWLWSEKMDGWMVIWDGVGKLYTKSGKMTLPAPQWFTKHLPKGNAIAGELVLKGKQATDVATLRRADGPWKEARLYAFDLPAERESSFLERTRKLKKLVQNQCPKKCPLRYIAQHVFYDSEIFLEEFRDITECRNAYDRGSEPCFGEGVIMTNPASLYTTGRCGRETRFKLKRREDAEAKVVGYNSGSLKVEINTGSGAKQFNIGIGLTKEQRANLKAHFPIGSFIKFSFRSLGTHGLPKEARLLGRRHAEDQLVKRAPPQRAPLQRAPPKKTSPKRAPPKKASPKRAPPKRASPKKAPPKRASPRTPKRAPPRSTSPPQACVEVTHGNGFPAWEVKKYQAQSRKAPPYRAKECANQLKIGKDKTYIYKSVPHKTSYRWAKLTKSPQAPRAQAPRAQAPRARAAQALRFGKMNFEISFRVLLRTFDDDDIIKKPTKHEMARVKQWYHKEIDKEIEMGIFKDDFTYSVNVDSDYIIIRGKASYRDFEKLDIKMLDDDGNHPLDFNGKEFFPVGRDFSVRKKPLKPSARKSAMKSSKCVEVLQENGFTASEERKYQTRPSPPYKAAQCALQERRGNDGKVYVAAPYGKTFRWRLSH